MAQGHTAAMEQGSDTCSEGQGQGGLAVSRGALGSILQKKRNRILANLNDSI